MMTKKDPERRESPKRKQSSLLTADVGPILIMLYLALEGNLAEGGSCQGQAPAAFWGRITGSERLGCSLWEPLRSGDPQISPNDDTTTVLRALSVTPARL